MDFNFPKTNLPLFNTVFVKGSLFNRWCVVSRKCYFHKYLNSAYLLQDKNIRTEYISTHKIYNMWVHSRSGLGEMYFTYMFGYTVIVTVIINSITSSSCAFIG